MFNRARIIGMFLLWSLGFGMGFTLRFARSRERIRTLRLQLAQNEAQMALLRDRLSNEVYKDSFSRASNRWLRAMALNLVAQIRELIRNWREQAEMIIRSSQPGSAPAKTNRDGKDSRDLYLGEIEALRIQTTAEYNRRFQSRTVHARDEMLKRLPQKTRDTATNITYNNPITAEEMETVAKDLEYLAKALP